jgi:hypothetical protein
MIDDDGTRQARWSLTDAMLDDGDETRFVLLGPRWLWLAVAVRFFLYFFLLTFRAEWNALCFGFSGSGLTHLIPGSDPGLTRRKRFGRTGR